LCCARKGRPAGGQGGQFFLEKTKGTEDNEDFINRLILDLADALGVTVDRVTIKDVSGPLEEGPGLTVVVSLPPDAAANDEAAAAFVAGIPEALRSSPSPLLGTGGALTLGDSDGDALQLGVLCDDGTTYAESGEECGGGDDNAGDDDWTTPLAAGLGTTAMVTLAVYAAAKMGLKKLISSKLMKKTTTSQATADDPAKRDCRDRRRGSASPSRSRSPHSRTNSRSKSNSKHSKSSHRSQSRSRSRSHSRSRSRSHSLESGRRGRPLPPRSAPPSVPSVARAAPSLGLALGLGPF
jgi:hypothetical protein